MYFVIALLASCLPATTNALLQARNQSSIVWQPCPEVNQEVTLSNEIEGVSFDCATLSVPLDYTTPDYKSLNLTLFKVNATAQPVLGSVLINFGGPGGTGAENLALTATGMAANIGPQWDLVSWDPRGTGKTIPFDCKINFTQLTSPSKRKRDTGTLSSANLTAYYLNGGWETAGYIADSCYTTMNETGQYIGTAFAARDLMRIVDALGEDGLLRYYGWSYGTALGSYVAAMFPDRMERVVLDANINPHDYQAGHYGEFVADADKAVTAFLAECLSHKEVCSLAQFTNASQIEDMLNPINEILRPLAANADITEEAWAIYASFQGSTIYNNLYYPALWPGLADTLTSMLKGPFPTNESDPSAPSSTPPPYNLGNPWATTGIRASDALWRTDSVEEYLPQVLYQDSVSSIDSQYPGLWVSARWKMDAKERYQGDFRVATKHPILYVNGEYDPACPLRNAYNASQSFEGSVVLPHNGYGHGLVVSPSACMAGYVQAYFRDGTLPPPNTHCDRDFGPWDALANGTEPRNNTSSFNSTNIPQQPYPGGVSRVNVNLALLSIVVAAISGHLILLLY